MQKMQRTGRWREGKRGEEVIRRRGRGEGSEEGKEKSLKPEKGGEKWEKTKKKGKGRKESVSWSSKAKELITSFTSSLKISQKRAHTHTQFKKRGEI